jgi:hypothetical protein
LCEAGSMTDFLKEWLGSLNDFRNWLIREAA